METVLNKSELEEVQACATQMKQQIIKRLKEGRVDELQKAVEDKLREEMLLCAQNFFANELKEDLLKQFASQKTVLIDIGSEAVIAIANSLKEQLSKMVAEKMEYSWTAKKVIDALFS